MAIDYSTVTEAPGDQVTSQAVQMMVTRYAVASRYSQDHAILEVACGAGQGLGYIGRKARQVVGGDYAGDLVRLANDHYRGRVHLLQLDAHYLPFRDNTYDTAVMFEAIYYLADPARFVAECRRVLSSNGVLVVCTVNKDWSDFNPSPYSTRYYSAPELFNLLTTLGFETELFGAFPVAVESISDKMVSLTKRAAVALHLVPKSMKGKEWLKRVFYGSLTPLPAELDDDPANEMPLVPIASDKPTSEYKVIYAIGHLR